MNVVLQIVGEELLVTQFFRFQNVVLDVVLVGKAFPINVKSLPRLIQPANILLYAKRDIFSVTCAGSRLCLAPDPDPARLLRADSKKKKFYLISQYKNRLQHMTKI